MPRYLARVRVTLKPTVNDPQGTTVAHALSTLGFDTVEDVRVGKLIEVTLTATDRPAAETRVTEMAKKLLANPVIELFEIGVDALP